MLSWEDLSRYLRRYLSSSTDSTSSRQAAHYKYKKIMAKTRRVLEERNIRKITKVAGGSSFSITLPIEMIRKLGWRERQKVVVSMRGEKLTIEDWPVQGKKKSQKR